MGLRLRSITADELKTFHQTMSAPFGFDPTEDMFQRFQQVFELDRLRSMFEEDQFLFGIDLISSISYWNQPLDDPLRWWLLDPRRMERKVEDSLWIRPVDVPAALAGRRYSQAGTVLLGMRDELCPWNDGVYRLEVDSDGTASCRSTSAAAEVQLTPYALGAAYLGAHCWRDLARSGLVTGSADALARIDAMFAWDPQPWCQEIF